MTTAIRRRLGLVAVITAVGLLVYWALATTGVLTGTTVSYSGYDGSVLVSADGRTLTVGGFGYPCFGTVTPVAQQDAAQVALRLRWSIPNRHGTCNKAMGFVGAREVRLDAPLGMRTLVNGESGRALPWFDERRLLQPRRLPAGYVLTDLSPSVPGSHSAGTGPLAGCIQYYRSSAGGVITVSQVLGPLALPPDPQAQPTPVQVRGTWGQADSRSLTWSENGQTMRIAIYSQGSTGKPLTVADLITIADSAPYVGNG